MQLAGALLFGAHAPADAQTKVPSLIGHYSNQVWDDEQGSTVFGDIGIAIGSSEPEAWRAELTLNAELFEKLAYHLPQELKDNMAKLEQCLNG